MPAVHELSPGQIIARDFQITRRLGEGGMGAVYEARQLSTGATRAIKLMRPEIVQDPDMRRRFVQEARIGSQIKSDHVVQVVASGVDEATGAAFLAMELVEGTTLAVIMKRGRMGSDDLKEVFAQLCHALGAAHRAGIVHRDLKPENILVGPSHRSGVQYNVKVLDFGIAKVVAESMTRVTAAIGTPLWMAPEQTSAGHAITPATDVWPLGLLAFHLLTGTYFWRSAEGGANPMMLLREIVFDPLLSASERAREAGRADALPAGFDAWFARCVTRDPAARFQNATAANDALQALLGGAPAPQRASQPERGSVATDVSAATVAAASAHPAAATSMPSPAIVGASTSPSVPTAQPPPIGYLPTQGPPAGFGRGMPGPWPPHGVPPHAAYPQAPPPRGFAPSAGCIAGIVAAVILSGAAIVAAIVIVPELDASPTSGGEGRPTAPITPGPLTTAGSTIPQAPTGTVPGVTPGPVPAPTPRPIVVPPTLPTPTPDPLSGPPFDKNAAVTTLSAAATGAKSCKTTGGPTGSGSVRVTFQPSGNVSSASITGPPFAGTPTGGCVASRFRQASVPPFSGAPVTVSKSFTIDDDRK